MAWYKAVISIWESKPLIQRQQLMQMGRATSPVPNDKNWRLFQLQLLDLLFEKDELNSIENRIDDGDPHQHQGHWPASQRDPKMVRR